MAREFPIEGLPVEMRRTADGGYYQFGVNVDGVFIAFGSRKTGGVDDDFARADEAKANQPAPSPAPAAPSPAEPSTPSTPAEPTAPAESAPADTQPPTAG